MPPARREAALGAVQDFSAGRPAVGAARAAGMLVLCVVLSGVGVAIGTALSVGG